MAAGPLPTGRVRVAEGGIAGGEPVAGIMAAAANFAGFVKLRDAYLEYCALEEQARLESRGERRTYLPVVGVPPFFPASLYGTCYTN